ncbi:MAG: DNA-3-methyladenine glycosylase [Pirellulaceae bacterium]
MILPREFYDRPSAKVARDLLGRLLWRETAEGKCGGRIVEVEAYEGATDSAAHSYRGQTPRNASMFGPPGHAYVYAIHSRWCVNVVTEPEGVATAVLIRAIEPLIGLELMAKRRSESLLARRQRLAVRNSAAELIIPPRDLCRGPARLCEALAINRQQDGLDLTLGREIWIEDDPQFKLSHKMVRRSPRIGISTAQEKLLRFFVTDSPFVSGKRS